MFVIAIGLCIGSFLNVCIYRLPLQQDIVFDRSKCTSCGHVLQVLDLIPIFSYLLLRRRCRYCKSKISIQYPMIECITMCFTVYICHFYGIHLESVLLLFIAYLFIIISVIDINHMIILDSCLYVLLFIVCCYVFLTSNMCSLNRIVGIGMISSLLFILNCIKPNSFGGGDIKLYMVCGYLLGYQIWYAFMITLFLTSITCIPLMVKKKSIRFYIPFAPFICIGCYLVSLFI